MATLYEIDAAIKAAIDNGFVIDNDTGEVLDGAEQLEALEADRTAKLENTALYVKNLIADAGAIRAEETALHERRVSLEKKADRLKDYLSASLTAHGESKFETPRCALAFRASKALEIANESGFIDLQKSVGNMEFLTVKEPTVNKKAITDAIKGGRVVPGAQLVSKQNLQIK